MAARFLTCLFAYNRPRFMLNAVRSIDAFFPWGDCLLVDDGSSDPVSRELLKKLPEDHPRWTVQVQPRSEERSFGGFYPNMRFALEYALEHGYDYCLFFEDDEQFVWKKEGYPEQIEAMFEACPDAIQLQPLLYRRLHPIFDEAEYLVDADAYRYCRGFATTGFWHLGRVREHPEYRFFCEHGDDLPKNSAYWMRQGKRLYGDTTPTIAVLPWVVSNTLRGAADLTAMDRDGFLLRPLTPAETAYIQDRPRDTPVFQEYFDLCPGNSDRPVWHRKGQWLHRYYTLCRMTVDAEDRQGQTPYRLPRIKGWAPSQLAPLASHMSWDPPLGPPPPPSAWRRFVKRVTPRRARRAVRERLADIRRFRLHNYLGYRELTRRLRAERAALPFVDESDDTT